MEYKYVFLKIYIYLDINYLRIGDSIGSGALIPGLTAGGTIAVPK